MTIKVTHAIAGLRPEDGGPAYSVPSLAAAQSRFGVDVLLRCLDARHLRDLGAAELRIHASGGIALSRRFRSSPELSSALRQDGLEGRILHAHGLWLAPNLYPARMRRAFTQVKLVHSPRGMLGEAALAISPWKKRIVWLLAQRAALAAADCIHATAASEYEEVRAAGLANPVAVIPNGIDIPEIQDVSFPPRGEFTVLALTRVHPKKGLDRLVRAWAQIENAFPMWRLRIVGPAELKHDRELEALAAELGARRAQIQGPQYGAQKEALLREADLFVLPTLNENFGIAVAEALARGVPAISTKGAPWSGLATEGCGWWIDHGVEPLAVALRAAMQLSDEERRRMGALGRAWMARDFGWDRIAGEMLEVYRWLEQGGAPPETVRLN